ncbi:MAG: hypothetical protein JNG83_04735 [Opitutaceae bacterium]|nr:hypothetical protein [Opitutaceae bacterium]
MDESPLTLDCAGEFAVGDDAGLRAWLGEHFEKQKAWVPAICGFHPQDHLIHRESIQPRKLSEPGYLTELVGNRYRNDDNVPWKLHTLNPLEGVPLPSEGTQRPALICGVSHAAVHAIQQRLLDLRLLPYRLELGTLPVLGTIMEHKARQNDKRAVVVVNIEPDRTTAFILGKEGVHTPAPVRNGFNSIVQAARKELHLTEADDVHARLREADEEVMLRASKFVRELGRDLKPLVDSYEMTTGQPVGEIHCTYLPPSLAWIAEPLAQVVGRTRFTMDCQAWLATANLQVADDLPAFGLHWLGALSLVTNQTPQKSNAGRA